MLRHYAAVLSGGLAFLVVASGEVLAAEPSGEVGVRLLSHTEQITEMDPVSWVRPKSILGPEYPKRALEQRLTGVVDVDLVVSEFGGVQEVRSIRSQPKNDDFEAVVRAVVEEWVFEVPTFRCAPSSTAGNLRVWFNIKAGEGVVSISYPLPLQDESKMGKGTELVTTNWDAVRRSVKYPSRARQFGAQADVYVELQVEPKTGKTAKLEVAKMYAHPTYEREFRSVVMRAAADLEFLPMPLRSEPVVVCVPFTFRLRD